MSTQETRLVVIEQFPHAQRLVAFPVRGNIRSVHLENVPPKLRYRFRCSAFGTQYRSVSEPVEFQHERARRSWIEREAVRAQSAEGCYQIAEPCEVLPEIEFTGAVPSTVPVRITAVVVD